MCCTRRTMPQKVMARKKVHQRYAAGQLLRAPAQLPSWGCTRWWGRPCLSKHCSMPEADSATRQHSSML